MLTGKPLTEQFFINDGRIKASWLRTQVTRLDDGIAMRVSDISELAETQLGLARLEVRFKGEEHFRRMIEAAPYAMAVTNGAGEFEIVNARMEQAFGYSRAELMSMTIDNLVPERFRARLPDTQLQPCAALASPPADEKEFCGQRKDSTEFPFEISFNAIAGEAVTKVLSAICDISDRRQKEQRIQADLMEKDVLLSEIHHRVKNNMQIVNSLLCLQSFQIKDPGARAMLLDSQYRINSMALIHQILYQSQDFARIDFGVFLNALAPSLMQSYLVDPSRVVLSIQPGALHLPIRRRSPVRPAGQ